MRTISKEYRTPSSGGQTFTILQKSTYGGTDALTMEFVGTVFGKDKWYVWTTESTDYPAMFKITVDGNRIIYEHHKHTKEFGKQWVQIDSDVAHDITTFSAMVYIKEMIDEYFKKLVEETTNEYSITINEAKYKFKYYPKYSGMELYKNGRPLQSLEVSQSEWEELMEEDFIQYIQKYTQEEILS